MTEQDGLEALKAKMSEKQRRDMAEIVQNEMRRRGLSNDEPAPAAYSAPARRKGSQGLSKDQVGELYSDLSSAVKKMRENKIDQELKQVRRMAGKREPREWFKMPKISMPQNPFAGSSAKVEGEELSSSSSWSKVALLVAIVALGGAKIYLGSSEQKSNEIAAVSAVDDARASLAMPAPVEVSVEEKLTTERISDTDSSKVAAVINQAQGNERQLLLELDARRVELEQRKDALDRREADLKAQQQAMSERLAELRTLTAKLRDQHKERNSQYEARLGQLANVYGAMGPNEAAVLISRLEDTTAIDLLQRMPEKRMGQILSFMDKERAVELTRILTDKSAFADRTHANN